MSDTDLAMATEALHRGLKEGETLHVAAVLQVGIVRVKVDYELTGAAAVGAVDSFLRSLTPPESSDA